MTTTVYMIFTVVVLETGGNITILHELKILSAFPNALKCVKLRNFLRIQCQQTPFRVEATAPYSETCGYCPFDAAFR